MLKKMDSGGFDINFVLHTHLASVLILHGRLSICHLTLNGRPLNTVINFLFFSSTTTDYVVLYAI